MISDAVYETAIAERDAARAELSDRDNQYREACACWKAAEAERDEYRASAEDLGKGIEVCWDEIAKLKEEMSTRIFHYDERVAELEGQLRRAESSH